MDYDRPCGRAYLFLIVFISVVFLYVLFKKRKDFASPPLGNKKNKKRFETIVPKKVN
jgi:hypothetical protein